VRDYRLILIDAAAALECGRERLGYAMRTQIERALFITARTFAESHWGLHLSSFSLSARERIDGLGSKKTGYDESRKLVLQAFELRAALSRLTSSDPYVAHDDFGEAIPGRQQATAIFAKRLRRYAEGLATFIASGER
jgi:hypothetical protein